jgi:putative ABC transport system permease protein
MKFLKLVVRNAMRNRLRTLLTVGGSASLMFVLVFVMTAMTELQAWEGQAAKFTRVAVQHSTGLATFLPYELERYLKGEEVSAHAAHVAKMNWFGGVYKDPSNFFARFAIDHEVIRELFPEYALPEDQYKRLCELKNGCIVGGSLAKRYGLSLGSRVPIQGDIYPCADDIRMEEVLYFRWDHFDDLLGQRKWVGTYWMMAKTPEDVSKLKQMIDARTKNSSDPTETMSEKEFNLQFMSMMGNVRAIVMVVAGIVLVIMTLMTANTMAMSARERVTEVAVLRTIGFTSDRILFLILAESVLVTLTGAVAALGLALLVFNVAHGSPAPAFFPYFLVQPKTVAIALGAALGAGLVSAAVPAVSAARRTIVDGLRQVV